VDLGEIQLAYMTNRRDRWGNALSRPVTGDCACSTGELLRLVRQVYENSDDIRRIGLRI